MHGGIICHGAGRLVVAGKVVSNKKRKRDERKGNQLSHSGCSGTDKDYAEIGCFANSFARWRIQTAPSKV